MGGRAQEGQFLFLVPETWVVWVWFAHLLGSSGDLWLQKFLQTKKWSFYVGGWGKGVGRKACKGICLLGYRAFPRYGPHCRRLRSKSAVVGLERGFSLLLLDDVPSASFENYFACIPVLQLAERQLCLPGQQWENPWRRLFVSSPPHNPSVQKRPSRI